MKNKPAHRKMTLRRLALAALLTVTAAAAAVPAPTIEAAPQHPVSIVFDGEKLQADAFIERDTTFVPFRALFERLGLTVGYDDATKTVTGSGVGIGAIALRVGSPAATVDGETRILQTPPIIVDGRTFVPLRFVSENAGALVLWDGPARSVTVTTGPSIEERMETARTAYETYVDATNREDAAAVLRAFHPSSPLRETLRFALSDAFARRDVHTRVESFVVDAVQGETATLFVTEHSSKLGGAFYVDNRTDLRVTMRRTPAGGWGIYEAEPLSREWTSPFGAASPNADIAPEDEEAGRNMMTAYLEALQREDLQGALQLVHSVSPSRSATEATLRWMFETYDLTHELESARVLERTADEMYVHTVQTMRKTFGPKLADVRTESIHTLRRLANGQWRLYATIEGGRETLSIPQ